MKKWIYVFAVLLLIMSALASGYKYNTIGTTYSIIDALDKVGFVSAYLIIVNLRPAPSARWALGRIVLTLLLWGLLSFIVRMYVFKDILI